MPAPGAAGRATPGVRAVPRRAHRTARRSRSPRTAAAGLPAPDAARSPGSATGTSTSASPSAAAPGCQHHPALQQCAELQRASHPVQHREPAAGSTGTTGATWRAASAADRPSPAIRAPAPASRDGCCSSVAAHWSPAPTVDSCTSGHATSNGSSIRRTRWRNIAAPCRAAASATRRRSRPPRRTAACVPGAAARSATSTPHAGLAVGGGEARLHQRAVGQRRVEEHAGQHRQRAQVVHRVQAVLRCIGARACSVERASCARATQAVTDDRDHAEHRQRRRGSPAPAGSTRWHPRQRCC